MKNFAEKIRALIAPRKESVKDSTPFDFVKTKKAIIRELVISKQANNIVGVYCSAFGEGMFLVAVETIERDLNQDVIVFHQYDMSGRLLPRTRIDLHEIQMVCPFNKGYQNPLFSEKLNGKSKNTVASV